MTPHDIGFVYNELRTHRVLYSHPARGRRRAEQEVEAIRILTRAGGRLGDLEEFLTTQGLRLIVRDVQQLGVAGEGLAYIAVRDAANSAPAHVRRDQIVRTLTDNRRDETQERVAVWATFLVLHLLYFLYTRDERPIEAVSAHKDSSVDIEDFLEEARRRIEAIRARAESDEDSRRASIRSILTGLSEQRLETRVRTFFRSMVSLGILEQIADLAVRVDGRAEPVFRQTLWSAVDIAENFRRYAPHLLVEDPVDQVDSVGTATEVLTAELAGTGDRYAEDLVEAETLDEAAGDES